MQCRHYIKDETMRTLFGLVPFYGGDDGPMDQMVKATLASVRPDAIDVRNEAGDTLLILACQHGCEVRLVETYRLRQPHAGLKTTLCSSVLECGFHKFQALDLVEPILAKGANPTAVNAVGICALHYTCFADSLSYDAAEALLWKGAETSTAETTYGCTPLHYAASSGDAEICALLVEHGAQPKASNATQDYYNYTAVKYAKDAGHEHVVELLGGEEEGEGWEEVEEAYTGMGTGEEGEASGPTGGLWIRHIDPQTELAYYMNDETGESWWETDLQAVAKEFLATVPATAGGVNGSKTGAVSASITLPPLGVREWLVQEQVRSWLVAIFSRADPLKLMEVDLAMQIGKVWLWAFPSVFAMLMTLHEMRWTPKADFKEMLQALMIRYGIKKMDFLREASFPKLEPLGVSSLIPSEDELSKSGAEQSTPKTDGEQKPPATEDGAHAQPSRAAEGHRSSREATELVPAALTTRKHSSTSIGRIAAVGQQGGRDNNNNNNNNNNGSSSSNRSLYRGASSQHNLQRVDSPAVLRAEADKVFQDNELAEERQRQTSALNEQRKTLRSLEEDLRKREAALAKTKEEAEEAMSGVAKLQSALADDSSGQAAIDSLSEEITKLKAGVAAEKVRLSHITETLEATKGSVEEQAQEEDRRVRLERLRSDNVAEVEKIRTDAADSLGKAEQAWDTERVELERDLTEKGAGKVDEARAWMKQHAEEHAGSKQIDQTNKQLHTSLRREMERAKQLHNQIEDTKGQTRMYARVRPMDALEKEAGCKEVCLRDGKQTLALLTAVQQHWTFTHVFQNASAEVAATTAAQAELHKEVAGLGTTLADGHNVLLMAVGASRSGKTLALVGEPDQTAAGAGGDGFFFADISGEDEKRTATPAATASQGESKKVPKRGKGKVGGGGGGGERGNEGALGDGGGGVAVKVTPLAGVFPRLVAETFATLKHRVAQCAFVVWVSVVAVSIPVAPQVATDSSGVVESLLPPVDSPPVCGDSSSVVREGDTSDNKKNEGEPNATSPAPTEGENRWGREIAASSPQEVMRIVMDARSRAMSSPEAGGSGNSREVRKDRHFLSRIRVELVNRSTREASSCEMVIVELVEEMPGEAWPAALADTVRTHAAATVVNTNKAYRADGLPGMVRSCLADTAKVVTILCVSPADNYADKTEKTLSFGKACENSGENGAAQLKDLKKELARLKKEATGTRKTAPTQLPRPAGGKRL
ncbi:unnamed protein product [Ectocarpus sp. CCAP 1310/34]|nr:unnamed protein product [Ectocarpus sp. CCAP 1310/34]